MKANLELIPLRFLAAGERGRVSELTGAPDAVQRLRELGFCLGAMIEMLQPGSPCIVRLADHKLCFRDSDSLGVLVKCGETS